MAALVSIIKHHYHKNKLHTNMLIIFMMLFILITIPSMFLVRHFNQKNTQEQMDQISLNNLSLSDANLTQTLNGAGKISTSLLSNNVLQSFLRRPAKMHDPSEITLLENTLYNACATSANHLSAYLYTADGFCYFSDSNGKKKLGKTSVNQADIYLQIEEADGKTVYLDSSGIYPDVQGISAARIIKNLDTLEPMGILVINIPSKDLASAFPDSTVSRGFILSKENISVLSSLSFSFDYTTLIPPENHLSYILPVKEKNADGFLYYKALDNYPFFIGIFQDFRSMSEVGFSTFLMILLLLMINFVLILIGIYMVSVSLTRPITALAEKIRQLHRKEFRKIHTDFESSNEIGYLACSYNEMTVEIQELLKKELAAEKHRRHLELSLLQAQFKPHFLYNTIDSARILCLSGDTKDAQSLLKAMGIYYQTILSKGMDLISIDHELNSIKQYETILSFQDNHDFLIQYDVSEEVRPLPILKFILQPLVENCIKHGLYGLDEGIITITCRFSGEDILYLSVEDNGRGMEPELVRQITGKTYLSPSRSFGLAATLERMQLFYGQDCSYAIDSTRNQGTRISFTIIHFSSHAYKENPL